MVKGVRLIFECLFKRYSQTLVLPEAVPPAMPTMRGLFIKILNIINRASYHSSHCRHPRRTAVSPGGLCRGLSHRRLPRSQLLPLFVEEVLLTGHAQCRGALTSYSPRSDNMMQSS